MKKIIKKKKRKPIDCPNCGHRYSAVCRHDEGITNMGGRETYVTMLCGCPSPFRRYVRA